MLRFRTRATLPACCDDLPTCMPTLTRSFYLGIPVPSCNLASSTKHGQKRTCLSFRLKRSCLFTRVPLSFSSALRPFLSSLCLFLVRTAFETANGHNDGVTALGHLCTPLIKAVLDAEETSLILFSALPF